MHQTTSFSRLCRFALAATLAGLLAACAAGKPELQEFAPAGEAFSVRMSADPQHQEQSQDTPGGTITAKGWSSEVDGVALMVTTMALPADVLKQRPAMGTMAALNLARDDLRGAMPDATILREDFATLGALTGNEFELQFPGHAEMTLRQFISDGTFYQVATKRPPDPTPEQEALSAEFLGSFKLK